MWPGIVIENFPFVVDYLSSSRFLVKSQAGGTYSSRQAADISICSEGAPWVRCPPTLNLHI